MLAEVKDSKNLQMLITLGKLHKLNCLKAIDVFVLICTHFRTKINVIKYSWTYYCPHRYTSDSFPSFKQSNSLHIITWFGFGSHLDHFLAEVAANPFVTPGICTLTMERWSCVTKVIGTSRSRPHTSHSHEKIAVPMYVCELICRDTLSMCSSSACAYWYCDSIKIVNTC